MGWLDDVTCTVVGGDGKCLAVDVIVIGEADSYNSDLSRSIKTGWEA